MSRHLAIGGPRQIGRLMRDGILPVGDGEEKSFPAFTMGHLGRQAGVVAGIVEVRRRIKTA